MNQKEWKTSGRYPGKYKWYNQTRKIQKSLQYNQDHNANVIHHLRDTEEQRNYNDEHYELWGFEIDGNGNKHFEYGKYVVFVTKEWHDNYHTLLEETREKIGNASRARWQDPSYRESHSGENSAWYGKTHSDESKQKISNAKKLYYKENRMPDDVRRRISESGKGKHSGENNGMFGKPSKFKGVPRSEDTRRKISESKKGYHHTDETKRKLSESHSGENSALYGKNRPDDTKKKISSTIREISVKYSEHKLNNGTMTWNEFQHYIKQLNLGLQDE